nr:MAG TPA: hypothetical protein [Caudoviricetes sp.]
MKILKMETMKVIAGLFGALVIIAIIDISIIAIGEIPTLSLLVAIIGNWFIRTRKKVNEYEKKCNHQVLYCKKELNQEDLDKLPYSIKQRLGLK